MRVPLRLLVEVGFVTLLSEYGCVRFVACVLFIAVFLVGASLTVRVLPVVEAVRLRAPLR
jgi:hypothetical protein